MGHFYIAGKLDLEALNALRLYRLRLGLSPDLPHQPKPFFAEIGAWADHLARERLGQPWDLFVTATFRPVAVSIANSQGFLETERFVRNHSSIANISNISAADFSEKVASRTPSARHVENAFREFLNLLEARLQARVSYLVGFEAGKLTGANHYHALLAGNGLSDLSRMEEVRPFMQKHYGRALVLPFEPERGAGWYLAASYIGKARLWWAVDVGKGRRVEHRPKRGGEVQPIAPSACVPRAQFHMTLGRWHR